MATQKELIEIIQDLEYEVYFVDANDDGHLVAAVYDREDSLDIAGFLNEKYGGHQVFKDGKRIYKED